MSNTPSTPMRQAGLSRRLLLSHCVWLSLFMWSAVQQDDCVWRVSRQQQISASVRHFPHVSSVLLLTGLVPTFPPLCRACLCPHTPKPVTYHEPTVMCLLRVPRTLRVLVGVRVRVPVRACSCLFVPVCVIVRSAYVQACRPADGSLGWRTKCPPLRLALQVF